MANVAIESVVEDIDPLHLRLLEAILFAATEPMSERELAARMPSEANVSRLLRQLSDRYRDGGVTLARAGRTWAFCTAPDLAPWMRAPETEEKKLSRAAIETLAIIAYHQPITRAEIEEIRGVQLSKGTLDALFDLGWIRPRGHRPTPGRPSLWGTTDAFLRHFGLEKLADLPAMGELKAVGLLDPRPAVSIVTGGMDSGEDDTDSATDGPKVIFHK